MKEGGDQEVRFRSGQELGLGHGPEGEEARGLLWRRCSVSVSGVGIVGSSPGWSIIM